MSRHRFLLLAGVPALLFFCLLALVTTKTAAVLRLDAAISDQALRIALAHPDWRAVMAAVTVTGGPAVGTTVAVLGVIGLAFAGRRRDAGFVAAAVLASTGVRLLVLNTVDRPRPALRLAAASGWSFPSGHTTSAAVTAAVVIVLGRSLLARLWQRRALTAAALVWAAAVGVSRVALVVHWPTDVLAAWLMVTSIVLALLPLRRRPAATRCAVRGPTSPAVPRGRANAGCAPWRHVGEQGERQQRE
jgi:undecaprenyl-diphosphatase